MSVVVPALDEEEHIGDQLRALAAQTYDGGWELVVADNGCTDRTLEIVRGFEGAFPALVVADATARRGLNHARNVGAAVARGDFLAFCDADDVVSPEWLAAMARGAQLGDLVAGRLEFDTLNGSAARALYPWEPPSGLSSEYGFLPYVPGGNCGVWADVARSVGWDERFTFGSSDVEFAWRAQLATHRLHFEPGALIMQRQRSSLWRFARQYYSYGKSDPALHARFARYGMQHPDRALRIGTWRQLARRLPELAGSRERRARWIRHAARKCGRVAGTVTDRSPGHERRSGEQQPPAPRDDGRRPLRLVEVAIQWPPETFLQLKFEQLAARGVDVTVASTVPRRKAKGRIPGVRLQRVPTWAEPTVLKLFGIVRDGLGLLVREPRRLIALIDAVRRPRPPATEPTPWPEVVRLLHLFLRLAHLRPDVVHIEWMTAAAHHIALVDVWDCPVVVSCRGNPNQFAHSPVNGRWAAGLPLAFARASAVHCVCESVVADCVHFGLDPGKARVIRAAVDTDFFRPASRPHEHIGPLQVMTVGRLFWTKGHEYALQAIRLLLDDGVEARLDIVGDGPERGRIEGTIDDLELWGRVELLGRLPQAEVRRRLQRADVLLQPSLVEGIPNTVLEAMACGVPVVATDCDGMAEAVTDGRDGFVVPVRDPAAMTRALKALAGDAGLRAAMGAAGRARVESDFTVAQHVERTLEMYDEVRVMAAA